MRNITLRYTLSLLAFESATFFFIVKFCNSDYKLIVHSFLLLFFQWGAVPLKALVFPSLITMSKLMAVSCGKLLKSETF